MARTAKAIEDVQESGTVATFTAVPGTGTGNGFSITAVPAGHRTFIEVSAAGGASVVTILTNKIDDGLTVPDRTVTVGAASRKHIALRANEVQDDGDVYVDFSVSASVTVAALKVPLS